MLREGKQRILVIVEGERVEPAILERCFEILNLGIDYEIAPLLHECLSADQAHRQVLR